MKTLIFTIISLAAFYITPVFPANTAGKNMNLTITNKTNQRITFVKFVPSNPETSFVGIDTPILNPGQSAILTLATTSRTMLIGIADFEINHLASNDLPVFIMDPIADYQGSWAFKANNFMDTSTLDNYQLNHKISPDELVIKKAKISVINI